MLGEPLFYHLAIELFADHVSPEKQETLFLTVHCLCCREIRSAICFHPIHHLRSRVLRLVWARWLVILIPEPV